MNILILIYLSLLVAGGVTAAGSVIIFLIQNRTGKEVDRLKEKYRL